MRCGARFTSVSRRGAAELRAEVIALNGMEDHVHLVVRLNATLSAAALAKQVKGSSSHLVRQILGREEFKWQEGYGAFTISPWDVFKVREYVRRRQQEHHRDRTTKDVLESLG